MQVMDALRCYIELKGGWIPFSDFMRFALYEPGLGYYAAGARKFGAQGDFITAPTLTPLFGYAVARAIKPILLSTKPQVLELGAGNGDLAHAVLSRLGAAGIVVQYAILELSADLRQRQQDRLSAFSAQIEWLDALPDDIEGVVLANEVLDATPCERIVFEGDGFRRVGVAFRDGALVSNTKALTETSASLLRAVSARLPREEGYLSEVNLEAEGLIRTIAERQSSGVALWFDYGFPRAEFYHAQRREGTLMCHVQHRTHSDPFFAVGMQDITAHVDFTAMAEAARDAGATQIGYVSQAQFLLEAGLLDELLATGAPGSASYLAASNEINRLLNPAEMGELFKVLAVQRGDGRLPLGFARDQSFRL